MQYTVHPSGQRQAENTVYTDSAMVGQLGNVISVVNSERETIWQRYYNMLVANSIILALFTLFARETGPKMREVVFIGIFGLILCYYWANITIIGWAAYRRWSNAGANFSFPMLDNDANPLRRLREAPDVILNNALYIVYLFMVGYLFVMVNYIPLHFR